MSRRGRLAAAAVAAVAALALAGCGERSERTTPSGLQQLRVVLDYLPNADHVCIYEGLANGRFRRAGLDVKLIVPPDPSSPLKLLEAGRADLAISYQPEILLARDRGVPVVGVGALVQEPLTSIIAPASAKISSPRDLAGKTVGTAGIPYQSAYLSTILASAGVDAHKVHVIDVGFNLVPAMLSGKVAATLGGFWNYEGIQLALKGKRPTVIRVDRAGVPTYDELVLAARRQDIEHGAPAVRRFVQELGRACADVRRNPAAGVAALLAANPDLDRRLQAASVKATLPAFFPPGSRPFGWQDPAEWAAYGRWMYRNRLLQTEPVPDTAYTNEFLAGQGA